MPHPLSVGARESSESQKPQRKAWARASATPADSLFWTWPILRYQAFLNLKGSPFHSHLASSVKAIFNPRISERIDRLIPQWPESFMKSRFEKEYLRIVSCSQLRCCISIRRLKTHTDDRTSKSVVASGFALTHACRIPFST